MGSVNIASKSHNSPPRTIQKRKKRNPTQDEPNSESPVGVRIAREKRPSSTGVRRAVAGVGDGVGGVGSDERKGHHAHHLLREADRRDIRGGVRGEKNKTILS